MNRNTSNHFANYPQLNINRSRFEINHSYKTTLDAAKLIPIYCKEVVPGDTVQMKIGAAIRMTTPIFPVMDTAMADIYFFYCPNRILWEHYREFFGENRLTAWESEVQYEIPQIRAPQNGWAAGTLADYFGLPTKVPNIEVTHLPFRAYAMIYNEWFRNINTKDACEITMDETTITGVNTINDYVIDTQKGGGPINVARFHDYFTSALPEPQRGAQVAIGAPLPVYPMVNAIPVNDNISQMYWGSMSNAGDGAYWRVASGEYAISTTNNEYTDGQKWTGAPLDWQGGATNPIYSANGGTTLTNLDPTNATPATRSVVPMNLYADTNYLNVSDLYQAYAIQALLWRDGVGGSRYRDLIKSHFGVTTSDARVQIPEYLGGGRYTINIDQVVQTSSTDETSPQGNTSAYSLTNIADNVFTKSFEESGIIMGVMCIRQRESYQNGIDRYWTKKSRFDFYWPELANIAEQPIYNREIFAQGTEEDTEVFGYQEAWADMKYAQSQVTGAFRSNYDGTLDSWHYANNFDTLPTLAGLNDATDENIERTLAVMNEPQFIADFYFNTYYTRPMPIYSVPGLRSYM